TFLESVRGGLVAGIGVAVLFWTVIKVLANIEKSFNDIWGIKESRSWGRKFSDYLSVMLICPILVIVSSSATVFIATQIVMITEKVEILGFLSPVIFVLLKLVPYFMLWILFSFIYMFMPNTKVNFKSGLLAGMIAGTVYQIVQILYISFQIGASRFNAIYGSFAALPLFLVWLQLSWTIVLFGAEISFAHQNVDMYEFEPDCLTASHSFKRLIALRIMHLLVKDFVKGEKPLTATEISHALEIPIRLVRQILYELVESGIATETKTDEYKVPGFQPARDVDVLTMRYVIDALEHRGVENIPVAQSEELKKIDQSLQAFKKQMERAPENKLLKEL
ncbi:YhjD/YihY/BrkB family envelope integrity protein, partial [Candidatus Omnitrophota bacterium]